MARKTEDLHYITRGLNEDFINYDNSPSLPENDNPIKIASFLSVSSEELLDNIGNINISSDPEDDNSLPLYFGAEGTNLAFELVAIDDSGLYTVAIMNKDGSTFNGLDTDPEVFASSFLQTFEPNSSTMNMFRELLRSLEEPQISDVLLVDSHRDNPLYIKDFFHELYIQAFYHKEVLPQAYASALVNSDESGLTDGEQKWLSDFIDQRLEENPQWDSMMAENVVFEDIDSDSNYNPRSSYTVELTDEEYDNVSLPEPAEYLFRVKKERDWDDPKLFIDAKLSDDDYILMTTENMDMQNPDAHGSPVMIVDKDTKNLFGRGGMSSHFYLQSVGQIREQMKAVDIKENDSLTHLLKRLDTLYKDDGVSSLAVEPSVPKKTTRMKP